MNVFNENLKKLLDVNKISIRELAKKTDIPYTTIQSYLKNDTLPNVENAFKIAQFFYCSMEFLLGYESNSNNVFSNYVLNIYEKLPLNKKIEVIQFLRFQEKISPYLTLDELETIYNLEKKRFIDIKDIDLLNGQNPRIDTFESIEKKQNEIKDLEKNNDIQ